MAWATLDEIDKRILMILMVDGRASLIDIARELKKLGFNVTVTTVRRRIESMVEKGIIKKFTVQLDAKKVNFDYLSLLEMKIDPSMLSSAAKNLSSMYEITELYVVEDESNIFAKVRCRSSEDLIKFIERLSSIPYIKDLKSRLVLRPVKEEDTFIPIVKEAHVKVLDFDEDGENEVVLENDKILLSIKPNAGGRITNLIYKETGANECCPTLGILFDNFLEEGWGVYLSNSRYDYKVRKSPNGAAEVLLNTQLNGRHLKKIKLEKRITVNSSGSEFNVRYKVTNAHSGPQKVSLWICNYLNIGGAVGPEDWLYLPIENGTYVERFEPLYSGITWPTLFLKEISEEKYEKVYKRKHTQLSEERITNGWAAYYNQTTKEILGMIWNLKEVSLVKRFFSPSYYSIELVFTTKTLKPGESKEYDLTFIVERGDWTNVYSRWVEKYFSR
ncbi:MAG: hypothetical protein DRJ59_03165 [Thermoprotei archaeon]|nr:MAG: hypothetical protein DRJ59_03165 [Thermoprotei archaeon]